MLKLDLSSLRTIREFIKYFLIAGDIAMTAHCLLLILGYANPIPEILFGLSFLGYITLMGSTYILQFCTNMRLLLTHCYVTQCFIHFQRAIGFGDMLIPLRYTMLILGVIIISKTIKDSYCKIS